MVDLAKDTESVLIRSVKHGLRLWVETYGRILTKAGKIITPELNPMQEEVVEVVSWCLQNKKPIRIIILKPRQKGCSTISTAIMYWLMCNYVINAVLIGGQYDQVDNLWKIFKRYADSDVFDWGFDRQVLERSARFYNGDQGAVGSALMRETAGDDEAGRSGTFQFMLATESARWKKGNAAEVLAGIMNCIPFLPETCVILESTAAGPFGFFYEYWQKSVHFRDFKKGEEGNGFIKIFSPWFDHEQDVGYIDDPIEEAKITDSYSDEERAMVGKYHLEARHVKYYRRTMAQECKDDPAVMMREYPGSPEEAFHASSNQRFNSVGLRLMENKARAISNKAKLGVLTGDGHRYVWEDTDTNEGMINIYEMPKEGCRYTLGVDVMTGESQTESSDPDLHSAILIRSAYKDSYGRHYPPKVAARTIHKCRWDIDVLTEWVWRLSCFYGGCLIVPEINMDRGMTLLLSHMGANLYERQTDDERSDVRSPKRTGKFGFRTTANSRNTILENLARTIREFDGEQPGIEVDIDTIKELQHFVVDPLSGRAEAANGHHDDSVIALAIALHCEAQGTIYRKRIDISDIPSDLREDVRILKERKRKKSGGRYG